MAVATVSPSVTTTEELSTKNIAASELSKTFSQRKQNAAMLASQYTSTKRFGEYSSVSLFVLLITITTFNVLQHVHLGNSWLIAASFLLSMVLADLFSGLVHWGADSWGNLETPLVGKTFIRSFREHHVDPFRITCHDLIETNGDNCLLTIVPLFLLTRAQIREENQTDIFIVSFLIGLCIWVSLTNQIHKWSHMRKPPGMVAFLQDWHIILSRKEHQIHHHTPFDRYYCITTGWLNPLLGAIGFWKRMENVITNLTGAVPRHDDAYWTVQKLAEEETGPSVVAEDLKQ
jgi:hypothetical protein